MRDSFLIQRPSAKMVLAAIAGLAPGSHLATDADNTLWAGDVGDEVVRIASAPPHAPWQPGQADFAQYEREIETDYIGACKFSAQLLARVPAGTADVRLRDAIASRVVPRTWLVQALRAAANRGVHVWLVSASPRLAVEIGAQLFGLEGLPIVAVDCEATQPLRFAEPVPIGAGKVAAWRALGLPPPDLALGDSRWDVPLLQSARTGMLLARAIDDLACRWT